MRYSKLLIPTVKEVPAEAEIPSHRLMIRAGFIRKVASGTYTYLPLGLRCLQKIMSIVREEMNTTGAQEIDMPFVQPMELWEQTGRRTDYGETLGWFTDRHGRDNALSPTAEEVVTSLVAAEVSSYKQLPLNLYQIKMKYRDEFRPRFGVLRSREFMMKDSYSFSATTENLDDIYQAMREAYCKMFKRCGLKFVVVQAQSGEIGGSGSEEFMVPCETGEDIIVHTEDGSYAANIEKAEIDSPAKSGEKTDTAAAEEVHTPNVGTIDAVCEFLKTKPDEMIKTLIYCTQPLEQFAKDLGEYQAKHHGQSPPAGTVDCGYYVVLVRGDHDVNEGKLNAIVKERFHEQNTIGMAMDDFVRRFTGADTGFAGPVNLQKPCKYIIDPSVAAMDVGVTGANKSDYHIKNVVPGRDFPLDGEDVIVTDIRNAVEGDMHDGKQLQFSRGIEVGHIFKLGTKYSEKLDATFLDENGASKPCIMGCYGIGINRILASAIEAGYDKNGCVLPVSIAPFEVEIIPLNNDKAEVCTAADNIYSELKKSGVDVLMDDRDARPGVKFKDADLLGIPLRVVVGERGLKEGNVEAKRRTDEKPTNIPVDDAVSTVLKWLDELKRDLH